MYHVCPDAAQRVGSKNHTSRLLADLGGNMVHASINLHMQAFNMPNKCYLYSIKMILSIKMMFGDEFLSHFDLLFSPCYPPLRCIALASHCH